MDIISSLQWFFWFHLLSLSFDAAISADSNTQKFYCYVLNKSLSYKSYNKD